MSAGAKPWAFLIVNFRPSNLGLLGFPLQSHAREKKEKKRKYKKQKENDFLNVSRDASMYFGLAGLKVFNP